MEFDFTTETITPNITNVLTIGGTGGLEIPIGTTVDRPDPAVNGTIRYNLDINKFELFQVDSWSSPLTTAELAQPLNQVVYGTGDGVTSDVEFTFDSASNALTMARPGTATVQAAVGEDLLFFGNEIIFQTSQTPDATRFIMGANGDLTANGSAGNAGDVLTSGGIGGQVVWAPNTGATALLSEVTQLRTEISRLEERLSRLEGK